VRSGYRGYSPGYLDAITWWAIPTQEDIMTRIEADLIRGLNLIEKAVEQPVPLCSFCDEPLSQKPSSNGLHVDCQQQLSEEMDEACGSD
jgi:hypothetical protein